MKGMIFLKKKKKEFTNSDLSIINEYVNKRHQIAEIRKAYEDRMAYIATLSYRDGKSYEIFNKVESELTDDEVNKLNRFIYDCEHPEWRTIVYDGFSTNYEVSNLGQIRNITTNHDLKLNFFRDGYCRITICVCCRPIDTTIHRLVAKAFIPNPENKPDVNHINGIKTCNWVGNLEWATKKENINHAISTGLAHRVGEGNPNNKYSIEDVHKACKLLEQGLEPMAISRMLPISKNVVANIKLGQNWASVSKLYNIPKPVNRERPVELKAQITELVKTGHGIDDIIQATGLPNTQFERSYVGLYRRRLLKKLAEHESSTTIDQL